MSLFSSILSGLGTRTQAQNVSSTTSAPTNQNGFQSSPPVSLQNGFNINEFKSAIQNNGLLKTNLYLVNFSQAPYPNGLMFYTETVEIPAVELAQQEIRRYGYGPVENVAWHPTFLPMRMNFIVEATQKNIIYNIMNSISKISPFMNYTDMNSTGVGVYGGSISATPYEVAYKKDYQFNLDVYVYNEQQDKIMIYTVRDCFARNIGGIQLGWGNNDSLMKADVTFSFTDYSINTFNAGSSDGVNSLAALQTSLGFNSASQTVDAIKRPTDVVDAINLSNAKSLLGTHFNLPSSSTNLQQNIGGFDTSILSILT